MSPHTVFSTRFLVPLGTRADLVVFGHTSIMTSPSFSHYSFTWLNLIFALADCVRDKKNLSDHRRPKLTFGESEELFIYLSIYRRLAKAKN